MLLGFASLLLLAAPAAAAAPPKVLELWPEGVPGLRADAGPERLVDGRFVNIHHPTLTVYEPPPGTANGTAVIASPGGGYVRLRIGDNGGPQTVWLNSLGVTVFVLKYRLADYGHPAPLLDVLRAVRLVRSRAAALGVRPDRIGVLGGSAGGHLSTGAAVFFDSPLGRTGASLDAVSARPDFAMLVYPVVTMTDPFAHKGSRTALLGDTPSSEGIALLSVEKHVRRDTPPMFLVGTMADATVPVENTLLLYQALRDAGVPAEMHVYAQGSHGDSLDPQYGPTAEWPKRAEEWMRFGGWLPPRGESFAEVARDGAWCWFSDPRAVARGDKTFAGWVTSDGSIEVGARDRKTGRTTTHVLHSKLERDDHDHPALLFLPDGRLAAFYSLHAKGDMRLRVTTRPEDITEWTSERSLGFARPDQGKQGTTYAHPTVLTGEDDRLYVFWRGSDFKPNVSVSRDLGLTWSPPRTLLARPGADGGNRPYLKMRSDGKNRIDLVFTDGHPRNEAANGVYYMRYERGAFFKADGTRIGSFDDLPLDPARGDRVYDGATNGRAWIWDVAADAGGRPVIAFTRHPAEDDHRYQIAGWKDDHWQIADVCRAGGWFPRTPPGQIEREPHYSGGMALNPADPFVLFTSRRIGSAFEIERWNSADAGVTWTGRAVTGGSRNDNVRPVVVPGSAGDDPTVLWMNNERYVHYTDFLTSIRAAWATGGRERSVDP